MALYHHFPEVKIRTWYTSMRTKFGRLLAQAQNHGQKREMTERETWVFENFAFLTKHIKRVPPAVGKMVSGKILSNWFISRNAVNSMIKPFVTTILLLEECITLRKKISYYSKCKMEYVCQSFVA